MFASGILSPRPFRWERARVRAKRLSSRIFALIPTLPHFVGEGARSSGGVVLVAAIASLLLSSCASSSNPTAPPERLTVLSYPDRPAKLPLWLAYEAGLFKKHGLDVQIIPAKSGEDVAEAAQRNGADIYVATANWIVSAIGDGADVIFFANTGYSVLKLIARPEITRVEELKGKRIGTGEPNSSQDRITRETLRRLGFNPDRDVKLVPFGSRSVLRVNALLKGEIDATTSNEDNLVDLERRGEM